MQEVAIAFPFRLISLEYKAAIYGVSCVKVHQCPGTVFTMDSNTQVSFERN